MEKSQQEDALQGRFLSFRLGDEIYAIEIRYVTEIIGILPITPLPESPEYVKGVISLRSQIIPVIDMRLRLCKSPAEYNDRTCVIVTDLSGFRTGLIVDTVMEVSEIGDGSIDPPPLRNKNGDERYIKGIGKVKDEIRLILDCGKLLGGDGSEPARPSK